MPGISKLLKKLFCGCTSPQSKEETASPPSRPVISKPIPHFKEWRQDPLEMSRIHPSYGKWIHDGIHEPYQEHRKFDTRGDPFVPKRAPIPQWLQLGADEQRVGARKSSSVYSRPTASPTPSVASTDSELERVASQIQRLEARNAATPSVSLRGRRPAEIQPGHAGAPRRYLRIPLRRDAFCLLNCSTRPLRCLGIQLFTPLSAPTTSASASNASTFGLPVDLSGPWVWSLGV
ncbi:hypothetical protein XPA_005662 [Xanthoria parietina]